jgi:S-adenosylmethionine:tRNA ribosyltransferase-isomerase
MPTSEYCLEDFIFDLPDEQIAQHPAERREESKLFVLDRRKAEYIHSIFHDLPEFIRPGDLLVFNDAKVIPARIYFKRDGGGIVEVILANKLNERNWQIICNRTKRLREGEVLAAKKNSAVCITIKKRAGDFFTITSNIELTDQLLESIGEIPLPPYIRRDATKQDSERYQTVYARKTGAVASPTAGLHFTDELLDRLKKAGAELSFLTLIVSWGTFQPVREDNLSLHKMHKEAYILPEDTAIAVNAARNDKRRIIAVGTTSLRVLETTFRNGENRPGRGGTDIFIYPPYEVKSIDCMITNFHTPCSTLLMLVAAFAGYETIMAAYKKAVEMKYRFFSYGDAMFIQ